ncbi:MAG TPA: F0F1 ATP synthase subunit A [Dehalococcoidales bacterium]|nr:F0F1 ATP synthase subunit A [Dehalococcoidales bacterium]
MSRKGCLGCSFPVLITIVVVVLAVGVVSLLSGALGKAIVGDVGLPELFTVEAPHVQLPAEGIFHIGGFAVTNTLLASWITIVILAFFAWAVTHRIKVIPSRLQNLLEFALEWLLNFCIDVAGEKNGRRFFPVITTIFLFVIMNSWLSLVPGFGSITFTAIEHGETHVLPLLRGANTDINFTLALALISFVFVEYLGIREGGLRYFTKFINVRQFGRGVGQLLRGKVKSGFGGIFMGVIDMFVGVLEGIGEMMRIVSFTFRLFGNMLGGEILILMMLFLMPFLLAVPFYGLEMLVGAIQALIFGGLTLVFATMAVTQHEHEASESS